MAVPRSCNPQTALTFVSRTMDTMSQGSCPEMRIGLAMSGGGFRAASFHLGVLKRMEELGVLPRLALVSTVSGGAIVGALYALRCSTRGDGTPGSYAISDLIAEMRPRLTANLRGCALFGRPDYAIRTVASLTIPGVRRMPLVVNRLDTVLYNGSHLSELPEWILINATNLRTGKAWKFFRDRAGDYLAGATEKTSKILVAEAVGASAAYPVLVDPYPFRTRWEDLRADLLDENRWQRPVARSHSDFSRWRRRFGRPSGNVIFPLVDGGIYDNEGLNGLRGAGVTHAILSNASPAEGDLLRAGTIRVLAQTVDVMHARLGSVTRQLAHEMTHGMHPNTARTTLKEIATELRRTAQESPTMSEQLSNAANRLESVAAVGWPPRGNQFEATSQILLHSPAIARNESAEYEAPLDIPSDERGLNEGLVEEIARVRTDLDALEPEVFDMLVAQGYFTADAYLKIGIPEVISACSNGRDPASRELKPAWDWAHRVVADANAHPEHTLAVLRTASRSSKLWGRCETMGVQIRLGTCASVGLITVILLAASTCWVLSRLASWLWSSF